MVNNVGKYFYSFIIGFCFGIAFSDIFGIFLYTLAFLITITLSVLFFFLLHKKVKQKEIPIPIVIGIIFISAFVLGGIRIDFFKNGEKELPLNPYEGEKVTLVGRVNDDLSNGKLPVTIFGVVEDNIPKTIKEEKILLNNVAGVFDYNDTIVIKGKLEKPENFDTKDGKDFDYVSYLKKQGIFHTISFATIVEQKKNDEITLKTLLYKIKNWFIGNVERVVSEPESSLANGVTVAGKGALPKDVQTDFVNAGIVHIVVLSGYNIAIVIRAMMSIFGFWGRRSGILFASIGIILFVIMTGGSPPVVRSAIMAGITLLGTLSYKNILQNRALFGAIFVMILLNPYSLLYDASFALSVLATFAIINCVDPFKKSMTFLTDKFGIKQTLAETFATQIIVLPYLLYEIGNLSIVAPLSNIIVLPFIPVIMLLTFIVGMLAWIPVVSLPFAGILIVLSTLIIGIAHLLANIPFASFQITHFPLWAMGLCYLIYYLVWLWIEKKRGSGMEKVVNTVEPY